MDGIVRLCPPTASPTHDWIIMMNTLPSAFELEQLCDEVPPLYRLDLPEMPRNTAILRMMRHMPSQLVLEMNSEPESLSRLTSGVSVPLEELNGESLTLHLNGCTIGKVILQQRDGRLCLQMQELVDQHTVSALFC